MSNIPDIMRYGNWVYKIVETHKGYSLIKGTNEVSKESTTPFRYSIDNLPSATLNQLHSNGAQASIGKELLKQELSKRLVDQSLVNAIIFGYEFENVGKFNFNNQMHNVTGFRSHQALQLFKCVSVVGIDDKTSYIMNINKVRKTALVTLLPSQKEYYCPTFEVQIAKIKEIFLPCISRMNEFV